MPLHYQGKKIKEVYYQGKKIKEAWYGGKRVFSSSIPVGTTIEFDILPAPATTTITLDPGEWRFVLADKGEVRVKENGTQIAYTFFNHGSPPSARVSGDKVQVENFYGIPTVLRATKISN